jgi:hypothetical protein
MTHCLAYPNWPVLEIPRNMRNVSHVVRADGSRAIYHSTSLVIFIERLAHEVDVIYELLALVPPKHKFVQQRERAYERAAIQALTQNIPSTCRAIKASSIDALDRLVNALVVASNVQYQCVCIVLRCFMQTNAGFPFGELWEEVRSL